MFLGREDVEALTGRKRPSLQIRWLTERGYPFDVAADGHPTVLRSVVEKRLGEKPKGRVQRPNFAAMG